jgi:hypothetical protein
VQKSISHPGVGPQGRIQQNTDGGGAIDPTSTIDLCTDLKRKA